MIELIMKAVFGCSHRRTTFPFTPARRKGAAAVQRQTYVVCLDCGKEMNYDWSEMRRRDALPAQAPLNESTVIAR